jgi:hypothetical protein
MALRQFPINATYLQLQGDSRAGRGEKWKNVDVAGN